MLLPQDIQWTIPLHAEHTYNAESSAEYIQTNMLRICNARKKIKVWSE